MIWREQRQNRLIIRCHNYHHHHQATTQQQQIQTRCLRIVLIFIMATSIVVSGSSDTKFSLADAKSSFEDDELSKTLDRSANEEWNQATSGFGHQLPDESQWQSLKKKMLLPETSELSSGKNESMQSYHDRQGPNDRSDDDLPTSEMDNLTDDNHQLVSVVNNQSNIVFTEPIDIIKFSSSDRSLATTLSNRVAPGNSTGNRSLTRYGWKSADNTQPIVSIIKLNNSTSLSFPTRLIQSMLATNEQKSNSSSRGENIFRQIIDEQRSKPELVAPELVNQNKSQENKRIYKSYRKKAMMEPHEGNMNHTSGTRMIAYSPSRDPGGGGGGSRRPTGGRILVTVAPEARRPMHNGQQSMLKAPLIITEEQLKMIADSEEANEPAPFSSPSANVGQASSESPTRDSFMFDASLLPMALSLMSSSGGASASELVPQTASYQDHYQPEMGSPEALDLDKLNQLTTTASDQLQVAQQQQLVTFANDKSPVDDGGGGGHQQQLATVDHHSRFQSHEPIVVETSPGPSAVDGQAAQISISNESDNDDEPPDDHSIDGSQEPFEHPPSEVREAESAPDAYDDRPNWLNDHRWPAKEARNVLKPQHRPEEPKKRRKAARERKLPRHQPSQKQQHHHQAEAATGHHKPPEQELLVGPFKSEAEAPSTITLAGIVYQKSGSSSSIVKSVPSASVQQPVIRVSQQQQQQVKFGGTKGGKQVAAHKQLLGESAGSDKYWPYHTSKIYPSSSPPSSAASSSVMGDILLGSVKSPESMSQLRLAPKPGANSHLAAYTSDANGNLRLSVPFSFSSGALLTSGSSSMVNHNSLGGGGGGNNNQLLQSLQMDDLDLLSPPRELVNKLQSSSVASFEDPSASSMSAEALSLLDSSMGSASSSLAAIQEQASANPVWASSNKNREQYYLGNLNLASTEANVQYAKHKEKSGPIVIVQKDVKPVKYHLLKAYLKLRRLLRPFEATYVFPGAPQPGPIMRRGPIRFPTVPERPIWSPPPRPPPPPPSEAPPPPSNSTSSAS